MSQNKTKFVSCYCFKLTINNRELMFISIPTPAGDKIKKNEMDWACGTYGWEEGGV